jgi:hypothetical protein
MKKIALFLSLAFVVTACQTSLPVITSTDTLEPTVSATPTLKPSPTKTLFPSSTPTLKPTRTPKPPQISEGTIFWRWGENYDWENTDSPYLVWGAQLRDIMNGTCQGFICGGKDLSEFDHTIWIFLGEGDYGQATFTFDQPLDTFALFFNKPMGFDALSGTTIDGKTVAYGYLVDGTVSASYLDGGNFSARTIIDAENKNMPVIEPCGIIDPNPNGDKSYSMSGNFMDFGAFFWNFLDRGFYNSPYATRKGYSLTSLTVISQSVTKISSDQICP